MPVDDVHSLTGGPRMASAFARVTPGWIPVTSVPFSPFANFTATHPVEKDIINRTTSAGRNRGLMPLTPHSPRSCQEHCGRTPRAGRSTALVILSGRRNIGYVLLMDAAPHDPRPSIPLSWNVSQ